jgi:hypothetical protein
VAKVASECADGDSCSYSPRAEFDWTMMDSKIRQNMNAKQIVPVIATLAPPLMIGGAVYLLVKCLFTDEDKEKKSESAPANAGAEGRVKPAPAPEYSAPKPAVVPPPSIPPPPKNPSPAFVPAFIPLRKDGAQVPQPPKRRIVTREDMATSFDRGARALTRTAAVASLKGLGFGKTAAYEALSAEGRFASWLQIAPDGIITWKG